MKGTHIAILKSKARNLGGLEKYASRIASAFAQKGAQVSILTTGLSKPSSTPSISLYPCTTSKWPSSLRMEQFDAYTAKWISEHKPNLIFGMDRNRFQTHFRAGNGVHISYLKSRILSEGYLKYWTCLLNPMHRKILSLEKAAFLHPSLRKIFTNSHMVKREILNYYTVDPDKIEVIHNGVEWEEMALPFALQPQGKAEMLQKWNLPKDAFHLLFIGNGYLRKGLHILLKALATIKTEDFHLSVIGKDNHIERFEAQAAQLGIRNKVRFFGSQEEIIPFYQLADALVIPSFYDPFANVTIEALAMGLFIVSSKHNGGHEILNPDNGVVIEDLLNIDSLAESLRTCFRHPKTPSLSEKIRNGVAPLDFSKQLNQLIKACE
jgi:UDP-glucose:(heptosyl)LPS alpha-1,3-glucosyltransferase